MVHNINPHRNADLHDNGRPALDVGRSVIQGGVAASRNGDDSAHRIGWRRWEGWAGRFRVRGKLVGKFEASHW
jgi:hypothetical protein